jgi:large subunit ribosomal protein L10
LAITKEQKGEILQGYIEMLAKAQGLVVSEYRGMTMSSFNNVRKALRGVNGSYTVTKNTLLKIALRENGFAAPDDLLLGPIAVAVAYIDVAKVAKTMLDAAKADEKLILKGAIMGKTVYQSAQIEALSTMPTLEGARASLVGTLQQPASRFVGLLAQPAQGLAAILKAYSDKQGEAA